MATSSSSSTFTRAGRPVTRTVSILSKRKSLWKMVKSILLPNRLVTTFASCGGGGVAARRKRRLERLRRNGGQTPMEKRSTIPTVPTPTDANATTNNNENDITLVVTETMQNMILAIDDGGNITANESSDEIHQVQITNVQVHTENELEINTQVIDNNTTDDVERPSQEQQQQEPEEIIVRLRNKSHENNRASSVDPTEDTFHGWRKSSIDVNIEPPLTLKWIPSGLQIGDQVIWLSEEQPERGVVRWIGKIRQKYFAGVEFERSIGNSSGLYGYGQGLVARLFQCDLGYGKFIPIDELVLHSDFHDKGIKAGFICIICRDDFLELPDAQGDDGHMIATKCGHLYHGTCLDGWFAAKNRARKVNGNNNATQPCPHCQSPILLEDIIRLFPAQV